VNGKRIKEKVKTASTTDNHQHPAVLSRGNGSYNMNRPAVIQELMNYCQINSTRDRYDLHGQSELNPAQNLEILKTPKLDSTRKLFKW